MEGMEEPQAAVAIVHRRDLPESILLIRRSERVSDPWSGHWSLPGGHRDPEDSDLIHTALRELAEECGVVLARDNLETELAPVVARRETGPFLLVAPFVFRIEGEPAIVLDPREAAEARWVPLELLADPAQHRRMPVPGFPPEVLFPGIRLDSGIPLWGFTYRLITEWLGVRVRDGA